MAAGEAALEAQVEDVEVAVAQHVLGLVEDDLVEEMVTMRSGGLALPEQRLEGQRRQLLLPELLAAGCARRGRDAGEQAQVLVQGARRDAGLPGAPRRSDVSSCSQRPRGRLKQSSRTSRPAVAARRAASMASSVLPVPAGPSKTMRGLPSMASRASNCSSV